MSVSYYDLANPGYPIIVKRIFEELRKYIIGVLYVEEDFDVASQRFILSDIQNGSEAALRDRPGTQHQPFAIIGEDGFSSNLDFPFTAYTLAHPIYDETRVNHLAKSGLIYSECLDALVATWPMEMEIPLITFYDRPDDYFRAVNILNEQAASLTRLDVPITLVNGKSFSLPVDLSLDISNGNYAFEFAEWLKTGRINDLVHNVTLRFYWFHLGFTPKKADGTGGPFSGGLFPIDDVMMNLNDAVSGEVIDSFSVPGNPTVTLPTLAEGAVGVALNPSLTFVFSEPMIENSVQNAIFISPVVPFHTTFNDISTHVTITFDVPLLPLTPYTIGILNTAKSGNFQTVVDDFLINFTTGTT